MNDSPTIPAELTVSTSRRKVFLYVVLPLLLVTGGWMGFKYARLHTALAYAHREFSKSQFMRAGFWTNRAFNIEPNNVEATRLMAEINEAQDQPTALAWRLRVVQLKPTSTPDIMAWAKCALRFHQNEMVQKALQYLPSDFSNRNADYNEFMGVCTLDLHELGLAEIYFLKAIELEPKNPLYRLNLATFRLQMYADANIRAECLKDLKELQADTCVRLLATRALLTEAIRSRDGTLAQHYAKNLQSLPEHTFSDELHCLEAITSKEVFNTTLDKIETLAQSDMPHAAETGEWLITHHMPSEMLRWYSKLPQSMQSQIRVQMAVAQAHLNLQNWENLQGLLANCHWENGEYLKEAMLVRCKRELGQPWEKDWNRLTVQLESAPQIEILLAQLLMDWQWRKEAIHLLMKASSRPETESRALQILWDSYSSTGETTELLHIARQQLNLDPSNPIHKNNVAFLSLLLNGITVTSENLARETCEINPQIPEWASTYAYALHLAGKKAESKKVMEALPPRALARPGVALYYAIVLAANGDTVKARECLAKLNPNGMLPEEKKLADGLARQLNPTTP